LRIIAVEREFENEIVEGNEKFKIRGKIDRIDELNGELRIIDYKSGKKLNRRDLIIKKNKELTTEKGIYNLQLLIYMLGIEKEYKGINIKSGIINLKNIKNGILEGKFNGITSLSSNELENYKTEIILLIKKLLNKKILFKN
jgi:ATP-dependent helicase/DNAse subunit B